MRPGLVNDGREDPHRVIVLERKDVREIARADVAVLPREQEALALGVTGDVARKRRESLAHLTSRPAKAPPELTKATIAVAVPFGLYALADDSQSRRILLRLLKLTKAKVDDEPPRMLPWVHRDVIAIEIRTDDVGVIDLGTAE